LKKILVCSGRRFRYPISSMTNTSTLASRLSRRRVEHLALPRHHHLRRRARHRPPPRVVRHQSFSIPARRRRDRRSRPRGARTSRPLRRSARVRPRSAHLDLRRPGLVQAQAPAPGVRPGRSPVHLRRSPHRRGLRRRCQPHPHLLTSLGLPAEPATFAPARAPPRPSSPGTTPRSLALSAAPTDRTPVGMDSSALTLPKRCQPHTRRASGHPGAISAHQPAPAAAAETPLERPWRGRVLRHARVGWSGHGQLPAGVRLEHDAVATGEALAFMFFDITSCVGTIF
jgi:hypothetical protein